MCAMLDSSPSTYRLCNDSFTVSHHTHDPLDAPTIELCRAAPQQAGGSEGEGEGEDVRCGASMVVVKMHVLEASEVDLMSVKCLEIATKAAEALGRNVLPWMSPMYDSINNRKHNSFIDSETHMSTRHCHKSITLSKAGQRAGNSPYSVVTSNT